MDRRKCTNYLLVDGKPYYTGSVLRIKEGKSTKDIYFVCSKDLRGTPYMDHIYVVYYTIGGNNEIPGFMPMEIFQECFLCVVDGVESADQMPKTRHIPDSQIPGMALGWLWYIFLMAIATIFKDNIGLWILISVVFFTWRHNKIQEEGTYIDW